MPIPLSLGLMAMRAAQKFHNAPAFERPKLLKNVYLLRVFGYLTLASTVLPKISPEDFSGFAEIERYNFE